MPVLVRRYSDGDALAAGAATSLAAMIAAIHTGGGVTGDGIARIVVTGGTMGEKVLEYLAAHQPGGPTPHPDFTRVMIYFGDERNVPVDHEDSNEGAARRALIDKLSATPTVFSWGLDGGPMDDAVKSYAHTIEETAPKGFDIHLLGMGGEGHVNSLFPHHPATSDKALTAQVNDSPKPPAQRCTLTLEAVRRAQRVWLLVSGESKADAVAGIFRGDSPAALPAAGATGRLETVLFADNAALSRTTL